MTLLVEDVDDKAKNRYKLEKVKKSRALTFPLSAVSDSMFSKVIGCKIAKQIWDKLKKEFERNSKVKAINASHSKDNLRCQG